MVPKFPTVFVASDGFAKFHYHSICSLKVTRFANLDKIYGLFFTFGTSLPPPPKKKKIEQDYYHNRMNVKISSPEISKFQENLRNAFHG